MSVHDPSKAESFRAGIGVRGVALDAKGARRLAVIMHRIWVDGTEFRWTRDVVAA